MESDVPIYACNVTLANIEFRAGTKTRSARKGGKSNRDGVIGRGEGVTRGEETKRESI